MNKFSSQNNKNWNENLNNSIFEKEGEYIINKKPKYKYDIKIVHENPNLKFSRRAKTPDKIISTSNSAILNNTKRAHCIKQNNNDSTIVFYSNNSPLRVYNLNNRYFQNKNYYCKCNPENIYHKGKCICQNEFNKFLKSYDGEYFYKYNYNYNNNCYKFENNLKTNNECNSGLNNCYKRKKIYIGNAGKKKLNQNYYFHSPLKVNEISHANIYNKGIENNNNNYYLLNPNSSNKKRKKIKKYTNKEIKMQSKNNVEKNHFSNYSFLSIDNSKNKNNSPFKSLIIAKKRSNKLNKNSLYKLQKNNENNNLVDTPFSQRSGSKKNNNIIINKSSETKQEIKIVPLGKKIDPLIIKKFVDKPKIKQIINKDGSVTDVVTQNKIVTSIESKPIINSENENIIKESITKVYTTISKNLEKNENENNNMIIDKNDYNNNNINKCNNEEENFIVKRNEEINVSNDNENNSVFIRRDFKDKKENNCNLEVIKKPNFEKNNYSFSNNIIINNNNNEKNIEINDNSTIPKNSDYNSFEFNSSYFIDNKIMTKNEQINYIKYLYYNDINNFNSFFLKLNGEDRENIINYFNDGNIENKKIYRKLKDILKNNNNEEEISIIINDDSFEDNK